VTLFLLLFNIGNGKRCMGAASPLHLHLRKSGRGEATIEFGLENSLDHKQQSFVPVNVAD
jgi:hypothetical protein